MNSQSNAELLDEFCDAIWLEDGLSRNTIESYRRDLRQFGDWLINESDKNLVDVVEADISAYLAARVSGRVVMRPSTQSRLLSSL